jgi:hypothetical protein
MPQEPAEYQTILTEVLRDISSSPARGVIMLRNFLYLNEATLDGYLSSLEDGLRAERATRQVKSSSVEGKASLGPVGGSGGNSTDVEMSDSYRDTSDARFQRFVDLCRNNQERSGWSDVVNADDDLPHMRPGDMFEFDCDIYVPQMIRALTKSGGLGEAVAMMKAFAPFMSAAGSTGVKMPDADKLEAVGAFASMSGDDLVVVGERDDSDWRISGRLIAGGIRDSELDGVARVVGKVASVLPEGQHKSLLALPGMNFLTREQRRAQATEGPKPGDEANWLQGPALVLDILAVYR